MKYVNVGKEIKDYDGKSIPGREGTIKVKDIMNQYVAGFTKENDPDKMILAWRIGQKIYDADGEVALEDAEFDLVKEAMKKPQHAAALYGPTYQELITAEEKAKEAEKKETKQ